MILSFNSCTYTVGLYTVYTLVYNKHYILTERGLQHVTKHNFTSYLIPEIIVVYHYLNVLVLYLYNHVMFQFPGACCESCAMKEIPKEEEALHNSNSLEIMCRNNV